ncbi:general substrate transporter [Fistulina hepatica ATCC 64428]|uniref:General substrate transporter n=1 Tax=Fistulina hepatica ATCC 64428 TaxID=1128425 RepID=A0A0D7AI79_9AGAR|nr:general substrate transporter [Fistulina hepatica ATCC 64428]
MFSWSSLSLWRIPPYVRYAVFTSLGGFIFGYDTGSIGPITLMDDFQRRFGPLSLTVQGLLVSMILIPAAIVSFGAGSISDRLSRTYATSLGAAIYGTGSLICCLSGINMSSASGLAMVFIGRTISGAGEGIFLSAVTVYSIEISPIKYRGRVGAIIQFGISSGILLFLGYFVCYGALNIPGSMSWRLPWMIQTLSCLVLCTGVRLLPHSPRWLLHVGRRAEAEVALMRLGLHVGELEGWVQDEEKQGKIAEDTEDTAPAAIIALQQQFKDPFSPELRGRTIMALFMLGAQQLSGIDGVLFYAPILFQQAGFSSSNASFLASGVTGLVNVAFTVVGQTLTDRCGHRPALIGGGIVTGIAMTIIGVLYSLDDLSQAGQYTVIAMIFLFLIAFVLTWAIHMRLWVAEAQPVRTRASVSAIALTVNWGINWVVAFTTPVFLDKYPNGPYFFWAACIWISVVVFALYLPETNGKNLDIGHGGLPLQIKWPFRRQGNPSAL